MLNGHISKKWNNKMTITYADIKAKREKLDESRKQHISRLRDAIAGLRNSYIDSLGLPGISWKDLNHADRPYLRLLDENEKDASPVTLDLGETYTARFILATAINDSPRGGEEAFIYVTLSIIDNEINVRLHQNTFNHGDEYKVSDGEDGAYIEVCEKIKDLVFMDIVDPHLSKESFKGWLSSP